MKNNWMKAVGLAGAAGVFAIIAASAQAQQDREEIILMGYSALFQDNYVKAVVEPFEQENPDIKVTYYGIQNAANALATLRTQKDAPQTDVVLFDLSIAKTASDEGLLAELDEVQVPNLADIGTVGSGLGKYGPPVTYDTFALLYNGETFPQAPASWEVLWDESQKGKIIVPSAGVGIQAILLTIVANRLAGEEDYNNSIQPGIDKLVKMAPLVQTWEPKPDAYTLVANNIGTLSTGWNARAQFYDDETDGAVKSATPQEGYAVQVNVISAVAGSRKQEAAQRFINYALSPEPQSRLAGLMYYAPTNTKAEVAPEVAARIPYLSDTTREKLIDVDWIAIAEVRNQIVEAWKRQVVPASR